MCTHKWLLHKPIQLLNLGTEVHVVNFLATLFYDFYKYAYMQKYIWYP